jgi:N-methylhydantoinase B/oxoprolinase/acetone carboxylase alpha subunit
MNYIGSGVIGQDCSISSGNDLWEPDAITEKSQDVIIHTPGGGDWGNERDRRYKWNKRSMSQKLVIKEVRRVQLTFGLEVRITL